jgi:capsular exopolysaccharide synthesis family protein
MSLINVDFQNQPGSNPLPGSSPIGGAVKKDSYNLDVFDLIKRKFWFIQFFVLVGIGLSLLYFVKAPKTYQSTSKIFVDEKSPPAMNASDGDSYVKETSIEQYLVTLKSTKILAPAISSGEFGGLDTFIECEDILYELREGTSLAVKPADSKSNSGVIKLSFTGKNQEECKLILEEVVDSFDQHIKSTTKNIGGETAELVGRVQNEMLTRLNEVEEEIQTLMSRPELLNIDGRIVNPHQVQLSMMNEELQALRRERIKNQARIQSISKDLASGTDMQNLVREIIRETYDSNSSSSAAQNQLVELKVTEQELLNQYGADHPDVQKVQKQIRVVDGLVVDELASMHSGFSGDTKAVVEGFVEELKRKVELLDLEEKGMLETVENEQRESSSVSALVEKLSALQRERERLEKGYSTIIEQLSEINAYNEHLWRNLSVLDPPSNAEKVAPSLPISLAAGLFLGSLMGLLFAGFKDMAEKTFRSSDDVAGLLNSRVVGHVSMFTKPRVNKKSQFPRVQPEVVTLHMPASQASESYRAIRTSIFFKAQESGGKVIQVTSPTPGDGKSTTISNLAASIAQSGRRVLLIDADLRKPVQHKLFGLTNEYGLSSVISGEMDTDEAIQVIQPEYLSVIAAGPIPSNPAELLTSTRFAAVIEDLRSRYDFVLIDSPPMLAVTDPSIICGHVDMVYLVMRIRNGVRTNALQAKDIIDSMGIEIGGVIINGIRRRDMKTYEYSGQYGYGSYSYGAPNQRRNGNGAPREKISATPPSRV